MKVLLSIVLLCCGVLSVSAQKKTDSTTKVEIVSARSLVHVTTDSGEIDKLIDTVVVKQGETYMYCDSAYFSLAKNTMEAFGNVRVIQPGSEAQSDYMRYVGNQKTGFMKGNVMLTDGRSHLWSEDLTYNTATKVGVYTQGGTLQDSTTTLSSNAGSYNTKSKDARFTGEVIVTDPQYNIVSDDMGYNTESKIVTFFAPSVVTSDSSVLTTSCGSYDTKNEIAHFKCRSSILNSEQYIEADTIDHNRKTGVGFAKGNVIALDTAQHTTLYCGRGDFNEKKKTMLASIKPVLKQVNNKDSLYIRADTFYSFPAGKKIDSSKQKATAKGKKKQKQVAIAEDTTSVNSKTPRCFIGFHHVLIFSDSMQGKCDSISYTQADSTMRLMYDPIVWSRKSQITGDTITMLLDSSKVRQIYVPNNAFMVSQSGPDKAQLYDQVQGKTMTGIFKDGQVDYMLVKPDAQTIYYGKDDNGAYIGVNEVTATRMRIYFKDEGLHKITYEQDVKSKLTPMDKADLPNMKLKRFRWLIDKRPTSIEQLFQ
jgi:lipopolysaccharide export system protein LptA